MGASQATIMLQAVCAENHLGTRDRLPLRPKPVKLCFS